MTRPLVVLLFGGTGAAGGSVLRACLRSSAVSEVRAVVRRPLALTNPKLRVIVHDDFLDYRGMLDSFAGVDACFFCLGISATQVREEAAYRRITRDFAMAAAATLRQASPDAVFHYLSGRGASLESRMMWARVKAEAERDLITAVDATCWRPGFIDGETSTSSPRAYQWVRPVFRLLRPFRRLYVAGEDIGRAMIWATRNGVRGRIIENAELREMADRQTTLAAQG